MVSVMASTCEDPHVQGRACIAFMPSISHGVPTTAMRGLGGNSPEVHVRQRERLVVEATGALAHLLGRGRQVRLALPRLLLALASHERAVYLSRFEQGDKQRAHHPAVLRALDHGVHARGEALVDPPDAVYGAAVARDLEIMFGAEPLLPF